MTGDGVGGSLDSWAGVTEVGTVYPPSTCTSAASSTVGEGDWGFEIMWSITRPFGLGSIKVSGERRSSRNSVGDLGSSLTGDADLGGGVGERGGGVGAFRTTGGGAVCRGGSIGGREGGGEILRGGGSFVSKFAMGMVGPTPRLWRTSETRGMVGER